MPLKNIQITLPYSANSNVLICGQTDTPKVLAAVWLSLYETQYSPAYIAQYLRAIDSLDEHFHSLTDCRDLDACLINCDSRTIETGLRSFISERQNIFVISGKEQKTTIQLACNALIAVLEEFRHRSSKYNGVKHELSRTIANIQSLHHFLRPPRRTEVKKVRSLPLKVIDEVFSTAHPMSKSNPFNGDQTKVRNFIILSLLYTTGLRRGELLLLPANAFKTEYDPSIEKNRYWLDVCDIGIYDERVTKPRLKNGYSARQIPIQEHLFHTLTEFATNRKRTKHGFLLSSSRGEPLSMRALNDIFQTITKSLSADAQRQLFDRCNTRKITPHNFRHSAAVDRIRAYRQSEIPMDQAESLMREYFGWSPNSNMPRLYAKAFYEEQLNSVWLEELDKRLERMTRL